MCHDVPSYMQGQVAEKDKVKSKESSQKAMKCHSWIFS
jgi:hypothetical protein